MLRDMARIAEHANLVAKQPSANEKAAEQPVDQPESKVNIVKAARTAVEQIAVETTVVPQTKEGEGKGMSENLSLQYQEMFKRLVQVMSTDSAVVAAAAAPMQRIEPPLTSTKVKGGTTAVPTTVVQSQVAQATMIQTQAVQTPAVHAPLVPAQLVPAQLVPAQVVPPAETAKQVNTVDNLVNSVEHSSALEENVTRKSRKGTPIKLEAALAPVKKQDEVTDLSVKHNVETSEVTVAEKQSAASDMAHPAKAHTPSRVPNVAPSGGAPLDLTTPKGSALAICNSPMSYEQPEDMSLKSHALTPPAPYTPPAPSVDDADGIRSQTLLLNGKKYEIVPLGDGRWISQNEYELLQGLGGISDNEKLTKSSNLETVPTVQIAAKRQLVCSSSSEDPCAKRQCKIGDKTAINMSKRLPDQNGNDQNGNQPAGKVVTSCGTDLDPRHLIDKEIQKYTCLTQLLKPQQ